MSSDWAPGEFDRMMLRRFGSNGGADPEVYATPAMVALRNAPGAALCSDPDCELSGGWAHVGPCEPCSCGAEHAVAECPEAA
jgi:hypothetical protein